MIKYHLKDLLEIKNGRDHKHLENGDIPIYGSGGIMRYGDQYLYDKASILLPRKGTLSNIQFVKEPFWTVDTIYYSVVKEDKAIPFYLYYYLKNLDLSRLNSGTGVPSMTFGAYYGIEVNLPNLNTQSQIAKVLSDLDAKIELNNKINAELEAMAKLNYDYWFVQFEFPNEDGKPYKSSGGKMVWNEELKREVPEGWDVKELKNCIENIVDYRGKTPKKLGFDWSENHNDIIALSAKHVKGGKLVNLNAANRVDENLYNSWMKEPLKNGDVLMTSEAPCGEFFYLVGKTKYCMSQRLFAIRSNNNIVQHSYLYFELSSGNGYSQIQGKMSGSTVFGIRQDELRTVKVLIPEMKIQIAFSAQIEKMYLQIRNNEYQNDQLVELRDWLLPMLMNGQVKVSEL
jgi:type I restriction enzyme S subunit